MDLWEKAEGGRGAGCFATLYRSGPDRLVRGGETKTCVASWCLVASQQSQFLYRKAVACGDIEFES